MATCTVGIILFFLGLYGIAKESSLYVSAAGGILLLIGLITLILAARGMPYSWPHPAVLVVSLAGIALYAYLNGFNDLFLGWLLWASVPYLFCIGVSCFAATRVAAIAAAVVALGFDVFVHYLVWTSKSSTAAIAYIYSPLWNTMVFVPITLFIAWLVVGRRASEQIHHGVP
jgi:hypothetical protein